MGIPVLILGESGSGKSASLRNFKKEEIGIINVAGKRLPFKNDLNSFKTDDYKTLTEVLKKAKTKTIIIDDAQYLMANEFMRRANERGFDKFTEIGKNYWSLVKETITESLPDDVIVYILQHVERDSEGNEKAKTIGRMLDEKITVEGMFTIVLKAAVSDGEYKFTTQTSGKDTIKSPIGMFESKEIDNDLKLVDKTIRAYWELNLVEKEKKDDK